MRKAIHRMVTARRAYRDALEAAHANSSPEAWAKLFAAGKELTSAQGPRAERRWHRAAAASTTEHLEQETEVRPEPALRPNSDVEMGTID